MDSLDPLTARGLPLEFGAYRVWPHGSAQARIVQQGIPGEREVVEPVIG